MNQHEFVMEKAIAEEIQQDRSLRSHDIKTTTMNPSVLSTETWKEQGKILLQENQYSAAIKSFNRAIELDPAAADLLHWRGEALADLGRYEEALRDFEGAILRQPTHVPHWVARGMVLIHLQQYEAALESCDKALSLAPGNQEAWLFRGVALNRLGRYRKAYQCYELATGNGCHSFLQRLIDHCFGRSQVSPISA